MSDILHANDRLFPNQSIASVDGSYRLIYQGDGNLVVYDRAGVAQWNSNTLGYPVGSFVMQGDGNAVIYNANGEPVWASGTCVGDIGAYLQMQPDGNLVLYLPNRTALWDAWTDRARRERPPLGKVWVCENHWEVGPDGIRYLVTQCGYR